MTRKTTKGAKPAAKKAKRLSLSTQTLKDLAPNKGGAAAVRGGGQNTGPVGCPPRTLFHCPPKTTIPSGCPAATSGCTVRL